MIGFRTQTSLLLSLILLGSFTVRGQCPTNNVLPINGYRCASNAQCENLAPGYYCYQGFCCSDDSEVINTVSYGGYCTMTIQCRTPGTLCISHICKCSSGSQYNGHSCSPINCPSNQVLINDSCYRKVSYGFQCNFTEQCGYIGAFCINGICRCQTGYAFNGSKCIPRIIVCSRNQLNINGQCYGLARLGEPCTYSRQCIDRWYRSLQCLNGHCALHMDDNPGPFCNDPLAEVEYVNGTVKNCLYWPCTVGYFCEYNKSGMYICCGTNANNIYGKVTFYPRTTKPMQCTTNSDCTFVETPNCVMSYRFGYKICCSTMNC